MADTERHDDGAPKLEDYPVRECRWTEDADGIWDAECGERFQFITSGPADNGMRFCPYCGARLVEVRHEEATT